MTFVAEVAGGLVTGAAAVATQAVAPAIATTIPTLATETVAAGFKAGAAAVVEPVAKTAAETVGTTVFEAAPPIAAALPAAETVVDSLASTPEALANPFVPSATPEAIFDGLPAHTGMEMLAKGLLEGRLDIPGMDVLPEEVAKSPQFQALAYFAQHAGIPEDAIQDPRFLESFAKQLDGVKEAAKKVPENERFSFFTKEMKQALSDTMKKYDEKEIEKLKEKAEMEAIRQRMNEYRKSIMQDDRMLPHAKAVALERVNNLESALQLDARLRLTFGRNMLTMLIGDALIASAKA